MFSFISSFLSLLPLKLRLHLLRLRAHFLIKWYTYFRTPISTGLCQVCRDTLQKKYGGHTQMQWNESIRGNGQELFETFGRVTCPHHTSIQSLKNSVDKNCMICVRLWLSLGDDANLLQDLDLQGDPLTYCYIAQAAEDNLDMFERGGNNCFLVSVGVPVSVLPSAPKPASFVLMPSANMASYTHWRLPSYSTNSDQSWYFARYWYDMCVQRHEECNRKRHEQSSDEQWYPTRLIKISRWSNKLRLVVTEKERPNTQYLTLSHCWGKADFIQLTRSSMEDFLKDIPHRKLPKTFQDAISVARRLGIYYIWIDSLCIIQREESLEDWRLEAPKMDKVYSHAALNIAATGATDSSKGLFFPRRSDTTRLYEIRLDWSIKLNLSIRFRILDFDYWKHLVAEEPLIQRAWVVQERLLAKRVLHFGSNQLFWECCQKDSSEDFPLGLPSVLMSSAQQNGFKYAEEIVMRLLESNHPIPAHAVWQRALHSYTRALLTNPNDRLIALAGIASALGPRFSSDYVVGLWKEYMATELLWYVRLDTLSSRQAAYRAPTFSWASVNGAVIPGEWQEEDILIEVQDTFALAETSNPFSCMENGFVRLRGMVKRATLRPNTLHMSRINVPRNARSRLPEQRRRGWGLHVLEMPYTEVFDSNVEMQLWSLQLEDVYAPTNVMPTWKAHYRETYDGQPEAPEIVGESWHMLGAEVFLDEELFSDSDVEPRAVYCVAVAGQSGSCNAVRGLILEPTGRIEGEYRRLGLFMTRHGDSINVLIVPHRSEGGIPCLEYDSDTHMHTFMII